MIHMEQNTTPAMRMAALRARVDQEQARNNQITNEGIGALAAQQQIDQAAFADKYGGTPQEVIESLNRLPEPDFWPKV